MHKYTVINPNAVKICALEHVVGIKGDSSDT